MMTNIDEFQARLADFRDARNWGQYHTPAELSRAIAIEGAELNRLYLWRRTPRREAVAEELADVMIFCLSLCNALGLSAAVAIEEKIEKNAARVVVGDGFAR